MPGLCYQKHRNDQEKDKVNVQLQSFIFFVDFKFSCHRSRLFVAHLILSLNPSFCSLEPEASNFYINLLPVQHITNKPENGDHT